MAAVPQCERKRFVGLWLDPDAHAALIERGPNISRTIRDAVSVAHRAEFLVGAAKPDDFEDEADQLKFAGLYGALARFIRMGEGETEA